MQIHFGCEIALECEQPTPLVFMLRVRPERRRFLLISDNLEISGGTTSVPYVDGFGNLCARTLAAPGKTLRVTTDGLMLDTGKPDPVLSSAQQVAIHQLPADVLRYLVSSRYCEVDLLSTFAWNTFGATPPGWQRVQAVCDFVHAHLTFGYEHARSSRSALQAFQERVGVCRDFAHLAVTLCRALGIPARYTTGYLGDIGVPFVPSAMDFSAWFEVWLDGGWFTFDARHNTPRIGRIPIAYGCDATDVAFVTSFGLHRLVSFKVWTDAVDPDRRTEARAQPQSAASPPPQQHVTAAS